MNHGASDTTLSQGKGTRVTAAGLAMIALLSAGVLGYYQFGQKQVSAPETLAAAKISETQGVHAPIQTQAVEFERHLSSRLNDLLTGFIAREDLRISIHTDLEGIQTTTIAENFDPDSRVLRRSQIREGSGDAANLDETSEYEISRTTQTRTQSAGSVRRIAVTVLVNQSALTDQISLERIRGLVEVAIGYTPDRGDRLEVASLPLAAATAETSPEVSNGLVQHFLTAGMANYLWIAAIAGLILFTILAGLRALRPTLPVSKPEVLPPLPLESEIATSAGLMNQGEILEPSHIRSAQYAAENPERALAIVRSWLHEAPEHAK